MVTPELIAVLDALDTILSAAAASAEAQRNGEPADAFRGLHLSAADVARELAREVGTPAFAMPCGLLVTLIAAEPRLSRIARDHALTGFDAATLVLALAPDIDVRYERLLAFLHDDVTRRRPTPALALDLFTADADGRMAAMDRFAPEAPLIAHSLVDLHPREGASRLSSALAVDPQILRYLTEEAGLDPRLESWCSLSAGGDPACPPPTAVGDMQAIEVLAREALGGRGVLFHLRGAHGTGKLRTARALAARLDRSLLAADLRGALHAPEGFHASWRRVLRHAALQDAVLFVHGYDALLAAGDHQTLRDVASTLPPAGGLAIVAGTREWDRRACPTARVVCVALDAEEARDRVWRAALDASGLDPSAEDLQRVVATPLRLTAGQIDAGISAATTGAAWDRARHAPDTTPIAERLRRAARAQTGHALDGLAHRIAPRRCWDDLVVPDETVQLLREIADRVVHRRRVLADWGFDARLSLGKGITALFAGPSGTGKTLAAEIVAGHLALDLFRIDLANIVSKYIGETEKNLDRVFEAACDANAVLLFDEADALFGKRTDVRDAHDRYANLEVAYLLQKMDEFGGLAILSSNLRHHLDEAFTRRLTFTVHFAFPEERERRRIWDIVWPQATPLAGDVDATALARELVLSGGHIRNAALSAAFYAAADGGVVTRSHVMRAARRELQKMGKVVVPESRA